MVSLRLWAACISAILAPASLSVAESFFDLPDENSENDARNPTTPVVAVVLPVPDGFASMDVFS